MATTRLFNFPAATQAYQQDVFYAGQGQTEKMMPLSVLADAINAQNPLTKAGFTTTGLTFTQPAVGTGVSVNVGTTAWMVVGQTVYVNGAGYYTVASITSGNTAVLTNVGGTANAPVGTVLPVGTGITMGGTPGLNGRDGQTFTEVTITVNTTAEPFKHYGIAAALTLAMPPVVSLTKDDAIKFTNMSGLTGLAGPLLDFTGHNIKGRVGGVLPFDGINDSATVQWSGNNTTGWV